MNTIPESLKSNPYYGILKDAIEMALGAGKIQLEYFRTDRLETVNKFNDADIVTRADKESEQLIINAIHNLYPDHSILAEESGVEDHTSQWRWVIDPLDGTTNFNNGLPLFCVSIGVQKDGETVAGVVYAPYLGELFYAAKDGGAYLNGNPIKVSAKDRLATSVLCTGFPIDKDRNPDNNLDNVARILPLVRCFRRLGSAAIDISYVAAGFLDGFWEMNLNPWDVCAGLLIAHEAGAISEKYRTDRKESVIVAPEKIFQLMRPLIK